MVRVGIRVMLGLQLVSSRFWYCFMSIFIWTAILCTCDIFACEINTFFIIIMVIWRVRWLKMSSIIVENCLYEYEICGNNEL